MEEPLAIVTQPPERLLRDSCHTHEHSDTFQREAYLRDILGPGPRREGPRRSSATGRPDTSCAQPALARPAR